ncbi:unnamed protein product [Pylaiella littoralis]
MASALCMLGISCATWELGRLVGSNYASQIFPLASVKQKGTGGASAGIQPSPCKLKTTRWLRFEYTHTVKIRQNRPRLWSKGGTNELATGEEEAYQTVTGENHPAIDRNAPAAEEQIVPVEVPVGEEMDRLHPDRFWKAYAADRYSLLTRGVVAGEGQESESGGSPATTGDSRVRLTKYLVFENTCHGLGNHMAGMMSAFALSIATERVFLHDWINPAAQAAASYDQIFVPPFEPWAISAATGSRVSGPGGLLGAMAGDNGENSGGGPRRSTLERKEEESVAPDERSWIKPPEISSAVQEGERCRLDLRPDGGVKRGVYNEVFITKRGVDPMPDCPVLFVTTNQFLVEVVSSPAYGSSKVGGILISEWLASGRASQTLYPGLFRPVVAVRHKVADESAKLFPAEGPIIAAHARSFFLGSIPRNNKFVGCIGKLAREHNASTVLLATDMGDFQAYAASKLGPSGIKVVTMDGVERSGEGKKMRNTLGKIQLALTEMMLVGEADFVVTSPRSSFSAIAAARGGASTERYGGISCVRLVNDPEFHTLDCAKNEWRVDQIKNLAEWDKIYPFVDSNRERCRG